MSRMTGMKKFTILAALMLAAFACKPAETPNADTTTKNAPAATGATITINGAGATFPYPIYSKWFDQYHTAHPNVQINYQSIGSGGGIKQLSAQTVFFGATDGPMNDEQLKSAPGPILHFPAVLGGVVPIYNVPGVTSQLHFSGALLADIYLGKITKWNDARIAKENAGVKLPATDIAVVHRSDGSGTTNAFTSYLDTVNAEWHTSVGKGKEVNWPVGNGAPGNDGVSAGVKQTDGGVGYVELQYAVVSGLSSAAVKNANGKFVQGSSAGVTAAAEGAVDAFPADFRAAPIINGAGDDTYPIAAYTYLLVYVDQQDATKGQALVAFIYWALTDGQNEEKAIGYAPLPEPIRAKALEELHQVTTGGAAIWP